MRDRCHLLAHAEPCRPGTKGDNFADDVVSWNDRRGPRGMVIALTHLYVAETHGRALHPDRNLAFTRIGFRDILHHKTPLPFSLNNDHRFHVQHLIRNIVQECGVHLLLCHPPGTILAVFQCSINHLAQQIIDCRVDFSGPRQQSFFQYWRKRNRCERRPDANDLRIQFVERFGHQASD